MILSHEKKFIFIHIYKVAGTSVRRILARYDNLSKDDFPWYENVKFWLGSRYGSFSDLSLNHIRASKVKRFISREQYNSYFKFSFVRNPWDWQVSLYHFMLQSTDHPQHNIIQKMKGFDEYIEWRINNDFELQKDFLYDENDNLIVDYIGKFENLQEDFNEICLRLEIKPVDLPITNKSKHKHYSEYYNKSTRDKIYEAYKTDIDYFHYDF